MQLLGHHSCRRRCGREGGEVLLLRPWAKTAAATAQGAAVAAHACSLPLQQLGRLLDYVIVDASGKATRSDLAYMQHTTKTGIRGR